jgi:hypothetical protein
MEGPKMTDEEYENLTMLWAERETSRFVCDPVEFVSRQLNYLRKIGDYLLINFEKEREKREKNND